MRISDWSSDVCSSDLRKRLWLETVQQVLADNRTIVGDGRQLIYVPMGKAGSASSSAPPLLTPDMVAPTVNADNDSDIRPRRNPRSGEEAEIGSESCRDRVCQYVTISVVAGSLK